MSTQKSLKASVIGDMCQAVAKHIVGESFINSISPTSGAPRRVVNHLYKPILQAVEVRLLFIRRLDTFFVCEDIDELDFRFDFSIRDCSHWRG